MLNDKNFRALSIIAVILSIISSAIAVEAYFKNRQEEKKAIH